MTITSKKVTGNSRISFLPKHLGNKMIMGENLVYNLADEHITGYNGGMWSFETLSNDGLILVPPSTGSTLNVVNGMNYSDVTVTPQAAGLFLTAMMLNSLCFSTAGETQDKFLAKHAAVMDFIYEHPEASSILKLLD